MHDKVLNMITLKYEGIVLIYKMKMFLKWNFTGTYNYEHQSASIICKTIFILKYSKNTGFVGGAPSFASAGIIRIITLCNAHGQP